MRGSRRLRIASIFVIGCMAAVLCYLLVPSLSSAWRGALSIVTGWGIVFFLAWRSKLGHEDLWWWPFAPPRPKDDGES